MVDAVNRLPLAVEIGPGRSAPSRRSTMRRTSRGSSMRRRISGTTADMRRRSCCTRFGTARPCASSGDSRSVINPIGLSSRTTSPVSVTHDVVVSPWNAMSTRNAGMIPSLVRTTSRSPIRTSTGALVSVAGSKIVHWWRDPASKPRVARRRDRLSVMTGDFGETALLGTRLAARRDRDGRGAARPPGSSRARSRRRAPGSDRCRGRARTERTSARSRGRPTPSYGSSSSRSSRTGSSPAARPPAARSPRPCGWSG